MLGMSKACIVFYFMFFKYLNFETFGNLKLILLSILGCMTVIFLGNLFVRLIKICQQQYLWESMGSTIMLPI